MIIALIRERLVTFGGQSHCMRPATADWIFFPPAKQHHFPGRFSGHHCLAHASLTSGDAFRRITSVLALFSEDGEPLNDQPVSLALTNPRPATTYHGSVPKQKGESKRLSSCITSGRYLLSHAVAHILPSARDGLTAGFGMEPGVSRPGIFTQNICSLKST